MAEIQSHFYHWKIINIMATMLMTIYRIGSFKTEIIFLRNKLTERNNLIKSFLPKNHIHQISISHKTDRNKDYHQDSTKHIFDLSNESNTCNGSEDIILMKKTDSSGRQQKGYKTSVFTTLYKKWSFLLKISSVNVTISAGVTFT